MSLMPVERIESYFNTDYYNALDTITRLEGQEMEEKAIQSYDQKVAASNKGTTMSTKSMIIIFSIAGITLLSLALLKKKGII